MADPFGKEAHEKAGFKPLTKGVIDGNWVLPGSNDKGYNCTQYAVGKLTGNHLNGVVMKTILLELIKSRHG